MSTENKNVAILEVAYSSAREQLIRSARFLFATNNYGKVSIRMIAKQAGVANSLISYYFGNKEGLFEAAVHEEIFEKYDIFMARLDNVTYHSFLELTEYWYAETLKKPLLSPVLARMMEMQANDPERKLVQKAILNQSRMIHDKVFATLIDKKMIRYDMDAKFCRLTWASLMSFPSMLPIPFWESAGIECNEEFLKKLFSHNLKIMCQGFLINPEDKKK